MKQAITVGTIGGVAVAMTAFILSAGLVPALLFGMLAGVPALVLVSCATSPEPPARLAPFRMPTPAPTAPARVVPQPVDGEGWHEWDDDDYASAYCTPSRYDSLTARRRNSRTYRLDDLAAPTPEPVPDELPIAVSDWPVPAVVESPAVVEPGAVPVVVGWTAARFAALELHSSGAQP